MASTVWIFKEISSQGAAGSTIRMPAILVLFFAHGGKWLISGVVCGIGAAVVRDAIRKKKHR